MTKEATDDLRVWLALSYQLSILELRESECRCDVNEFHCCDLCRECREKGNEADRLMHLWGDVWAAELARTKGIFVEEQSA